MAVALLPGGGLDSNCGVTSLSTESSDQLLRETTTRAAGCAVGSAVPEPADTDLLRRCRTGDAEAWATLVGRYERLVFSVALRNGVSWEDAGDVTQTTFIALLDAIDGLHDDERLGSWLMTVARRHAWRTRHRGERQNGLLDRSGTPHDAIEEWERLEWLHSGLSLLDDPCRELLTALYFDADSPSYAVIAPRLNRAVGSIGPLRGRCLDRLRALLEEAA